MYNPLSFRPKKKWHFSSVPQTLQDITFVFILIDIYAFPAELSLCSAFSTNYLYKADV